MFFLFWDFKGEYKLNYSIFHIRKEHYNAYQKIIPFLLHCTKSIQNPFEKDATHEGWSLISDRQVVRSESEISKMFNGSLQLIII